MLRHVTRVLFARNNGTVSKIDEFERTARTKMAEGWIDSTDRCSWIYSFFFLRLFDLWNNCDKFRLIYFLLKRNSVLLRLVFFFFPIKRKSIVLIWNLKYLIEKFRKLEGMYFLWKNNWIQLIVDSRNIMYYCKY